MVQMVQSHSNLKCCFNLLCHFAGVLEDFATTMTFTPSQDQVCFILRPIDDDVIEDVATLSLTLTPGDDAIFPVEGSTLTVNDNDCERINLDLAWHVQSLSPFSASCLLY